MRRPRIPRCIEAIAASNRVDTAYDGDAWSERLDGAFSELFETEVRAFWVTTGTAANCLALAALCPPYRAILCHKDAHIEVDEAGAPGFFTGGAKLVLLDGPGAKVTPEAVTEACDRIRQDVHQVQPAAISITNATEYGLVYRAAEVAALGQVAKERGLAFHMDGARFANALATTGESLADVTWRAGVDALSFGFVKNGGLNAEALILFGPSLPTRLRCGASAPGICCRRAACSRRRFSPCSRTVCGSTMPGPQTPRRRRLPGPRPIGSSIPSRRMRSSFVSRATKRRTCDALGFDFYDWGPGEIRLVTSWDQQAEAVEQLAAAHRRPVSAARSSDLPDRHPPLHGLHRDLGIDLDRDPRPARHRPAAMVGRLTASPSPPPQ